MHPAEVMLNEIHGLLESAHYFLPAEMTERMQKYGYTRTGTTPTEDGTWADVWLHKTGRILLFTQTTPPHYRIYLLSKAGVYQTAGG